MFNNRRALTLRGGASLLALTALTALAFAGGAQAQDAATKAKDDATEVVVVGVRKALQSAQQVKKNADTVVDSITATDIGAFPDKSVAEALQRVPGITVTRFAASDDSSHFSAEPSGVLIRGLTQVRTEFNGRDSFSADGARGLNFADIAPELMSRVDAYKNQTADMIEGGIAGTVDLRTRLPFDSKGQVLSISLKGNYGDISKKSTYDYSGLYSNTWDTSLGQFGLLADYANSHVITATNGVIMGRIATICSAGY
ncbi:MAG TPA: TonB-dependent receptor plug domain-containing protein, partial [Asticcacaulis sp.]